MPPPVNQFALFPTKQAIQALLEFRCPPCKIARLGGMDGIVHVEGIVFLGNGIHFRVIPQINDRNAPFFLQLQ